LPTDPDSSYFAVFDGHGGKQASYYCITPEIPPTHIFAGSRKVHTNMLQRKCYATDKKKALIKAFLITDHDYLLKTPEDGCTALAALLTADNTLYVANAGI
jgi:protein phosphatase 2C family protein 2/3